MESTRQWVARLTAGKPLHERLQIIDKLQSEARKIGDASLATLLGLIYEEVRQSESR